MNEKEEDLSHLERPLECSECRRPIRVCYTEVIGKSVTKTGMCEDCPVLRRKLQGHSLLSQKGVSDDSTSLCCGGCGLPLDDVKMGSPLGCPLCYEIFSEEILHELSQLEKIPLKAGLPKKGALLHAGRCPGEHTEMDPSLKLLALHQALDETLGREDYEQAALLRDQIKALEDSASKEGKKDDGQKS
jgi:protein arginine kinase activator